MRNGDLSLLTVSISLCLFVCYYCCVLLLIIIFNIVHNIITSDQLWWLFLSDSLSLFEFVHGLFLLLWPINYLSLSLSASLNVRHANIQSVYLNPSGLILLAVLGFGRKACLTRLIEYCRFASCGWVSWAIIAEWALISRWRLTDVVLL